MMFMELVDEGSESSDFSELLPEVSGNRHYFIQGAELAKAAAALRLHDSAH